MLADVNLVRCTITVYDSHFSRSGWTKMKKQLTYMSFVIPELLKVTGFQGVPNDLNLTQKMMNKPFDIQPRINYGKQNNIVFLLKFADYLSTGLDIDDVHPRNMGFFILKLAIEFIRDHAFV
ncbi:hypothetical protein FF1_019286 [Malus domestica]